MTSRFQPIIAIAIALALFSFACSKDLPGAMKAVPAGVDLVGSVDAKETLAYVKKTLPKLVPAKLKDQIPTLEMLTQQAMQLAGVDLSKLTHIHFFGHLKDNQKAGFIAEGIQIQGLKGKKTAEHNGVEIYSLAEGVHYCGIEKIGLVGSPSQAFLKTIIDTYKGDAKGLGSSERGKLLVDLMKVHEEMDMMRLYVLTGQMPDTGGLLEVKLQGGGVFFDLDKGGAMIMLADKESVDNIAKAIGMGLMTLQAGLMMGGGDDMPFELDGDAKKEIQNFLGKIKTAKKTDRVTVSYSGDLKPLIEKVASLGVKALQAEQAELAAPPAVPAPTAPTAVPASPAAPAEPAVK